MKTGVNELKKAVASFDQRSSHKRNSGASGTASRRKKLKASSPSLFDKGLEQGTQIPIFSTIDDMMKQVNMNRPAIVRLPSDLQSLMKEDRLTVVGLVVALGAQRTVRYSGVGLFGA